MTKYIVKAHDRDFFPELLFDSKEEAREAVVFLELTTRCVWKVIYKHVAE